MNKQLSYIEGNHYSEDILFENLNRNDLTNLTKKGVLEPINDLYKFNFVGVISIRNIAFTVLPKTLRNESNLSVATTIKTLKKYCNNNSKLFDGIDYFNVEPDHPECSELAISEFLIKDFQENGICRFEEKLLKLNADGNVDWDFTVNNIDPIYNRNQPVYIDTVNNITIDDQNNLTIAIHKWSLGYVSRKYIDYLASDLVSLAFDYEDDLNEIGTIDQLINHLHRQLSLIYSDREIRLVKSLIFLLKKKAGNLDNDLSLYGTKKYENVWEAICKLVVRDNYKSGEYFPNPKWNILNNIYHSKGTLIPDITTENSLTGEFYLFDAKYYSLKFINELSGEPSYKDVLKQFQYQQHIEKFKGNISNAFLIPIGESVYSNLLENPHVKYFNSDMVVVGSVEYSIYPEKKIWVILCPFSIWQNRYLNNKPLQYTEMYWAG